MYKILLTIEGKYGQKQTKENIIYKLYNDDNI